jgi:hypothetical protein
MKSIIRLLIPYKRNRVFEEFTDALQCKKDMFIDAIQNIVIRLKAIFPDEIEHLDISKYRSWIELNETRWKNKIEPVNLDKLFYGLAKETQ